MTELADILGGLQPRRRRMTPPIERPAYPLSIAWPPVAVAADGFRVREDDEPVAGNIQITSLDGFIAARAVCTMGCDREWLPVERPDGRVLMRRCPCSLHIMPAARRISAARIPSRLIRAVLPVTEEDGNKAAMPILSALRAGQCLSVGLHGDVGIGKSHLAAWVIIGAALMGARVRWVQLGPLEEEVKAGYSEKRSRGQTLHPYIEADLLVFDELEWKPDRMTSHTREIACDLVRGRYDRAKPIILTSNGARDDIRPLFDGRLWDRITSEVRFFHIRGENKRQKWGAARG